MIDDILKKLDELKIFDQNWINFLHKVPNVKNKATIKKFDVNWILLSTSAEHTFTGNIVRKEKRTERSQTKPTFCS